MIQLACVVIGFFLAMIATFFISMKSSTGDLAAVFSVITIVIGAISSVLIVSACFCLFTSI